MTDKLTPVRCGCGGEAEVGEVHFWGRCYTVQCSECGIETKPQNTEAEAIQEWNRAMGATDMNVGDKERTAKVIEKSVGRHSISDFDWTGKCEKCGNEVQYSFDYCPSCGARLEWK